eukprot:m.454006 g.454006  ORF g.454006 m.454006 type:complete len:163 (+) comp20595_c0_seq1:193-681(+)
MQVPKIRGCALSWWLVAALMVCQLKLSEASDCSATAVAKDGSRDARDCDEVDPHDVLRGFATKKVKGKTEKVPAIHPNFDYIKGSRWLWNNWREVEFTPEGNFVAPAENCDQPGNAACKWTATEDSLIVHFGGAGTHTLHVDDRSMTGVRDSDGDAVSAVRV